MSRSSLMNTKRPPLWSHGGLAYASPRQQSSLRNTQRRSGVWLVTVLLLLLSACVGYMVPRLITYYQTDNLASLAPSSSAVDSTDQALASNPLPSRFDASNKALSAKLAQNLQQKSLNEQISFCGKVQAAAKKKRLPTALKLKLPTGSTQIQQVPDVSLYKDDASSLRFPMYVYSTGDIVSHSLQAAKEWEFGETRQILESLEAVAKAQQLDRSSIYFIDIGAHVGAYTIPIAAHGFSVIAIEPIRSSAEALKMSLCANPELLERVTLLNRGLGFTPAKCIIISDDMNEGDGITKCSTTAEEFDQDGYSVRQSLELVSLDELLEDWIPDLAGHVGALKIDVEGFEGMVMQGAERFLDQVHPDYILTEVRAGMMRDETGISATQYIAYLQSFGYDVHVGGFNTPIIDPDIVLDPNYVFDKTYLTAQGKVGGGDTDAALSEPPVVLSQFQQAAAAGVSGADDVEIIEEEDSIPYSTSDEPFSELEESTEKHYHMAVAKSEPPAAVPIKRVAILGERNSGTNLVVTMFAKNLVQGFDVSPGVTAIKHYFQPCPQNDEDFEQLAAHTLVILVTRNVLDWLISQYNTCYCCESLSKTNGLSFDQFLNATFETSMENPFNHEKRPTPACPIDRNIYKTDGTEGVFGSVLAARYEKLDHFLNVSSWVPAFEIVGWENLLSVEHQTAWFGSIAEKWKLPRSAEFNALAQDARSWKEEEAPGVFSHKDRIAKSAYLNETLAQVDPEIKSMCVKVKERINNKLEGLMGYHSLNC